MANVMSAFRLTAVASLGAVNAAAISVTQTADSVAALAETAAAHATDNSIADLKVTSAERKRVRLLEAKENLAMRKVQLERRLAADSALQAAFDELDDQLLNLKPQPAPTITEDTKPHLAVAAE